VPVRKDDEIQVARGTYKVSAATGEASPMERLWQAFATMAGHRRGVMLQRCARHTSGRRGCFGASSCHCHQALQARDLGIMIFTTESLMNNVHRYAQGREGKVVAVYRRKWVIHVERITREKVHITLSARV